MKKKFTNHCARKTTVRKLKKAKIVSSEHIANVTGHRGINFLNDYDEADEEELRALAVAINEIMKTPVLRKSKYYINTGSFRHHNNCGFTHPLMAASEKTNCLLHFWVLNLNNFSMNPAMMWCIGEGGPEQRGGGS